MSWMDDVIASFATGGAGGGVYAVTRRAAGTYTGGVFVRGSSSTMNITAIVQPMDGRGMKFMPEGRNVEDVRLLYTSTALLAEPDADLVTIDGEPYEVYYVEPWELDGVAYRCHVARRVAP